MALTRKFLTALGIEADKADEIINVHQETLADVKAERDRYKADAEKLPGVQAEFEKAKATAKNGGDYDKLKKEFDDYKAEVAGKELRAKKADILREIAKDAGLSEAGIAKVIKYQDYDKLELDDKGAAKDKAAVLKALKEEWPEYITKQHTEGVNTATPPANTGGKKYASKQEIMEIKNTAERQQAIRENHELFGY